MRLTTLSALSAGAIFATLGLGVAWNATAVIPEAEGTATEGGSRGNGIDARLADPEKRAAAMEEIRKSRNATSEFKRIAASKGDLSARGWAIVGLSELDADGVDETLSSITDDAGEDRLVRSWAMAARVKRARSLKSLAALAGRQNEFAGLDRPVQMRASELLGQGADLEAVLELSRTPAMAGAMMGWVKDNATIGQLVDVELTGDNNDIRRQAAAMAASIGQADPAGVSKVVLSKLDINPNAKAVPWKGGALFIPSVNYSKEDAKKLSAALASWFLYCETNGKRPELQQVYNNLNSLGLLYKAGLQQHARMDAVSMAEIVKAVHGKKGAERLLGDLGIANEPRFKPVLQ